MNDDLRPQRVIVPSGLEVPVLPVRNTVLFPDVTTDIDVGRPKSVAVIEAQLADAQSLVLICPQRSPDIDEPAFEDLHPVGVLARLIRHTRNEDGTFRASMLGLARARLARVVRLEPYLSVGVEAVAESESDDAVCRALVGSLREQTEHLLAFVPEFPKEAKAVIASTREPEEVLHRLASHLDGTVADKVELLAEVPLDERLRRVLKLLVAQVETEKMRERINAQIKREMEGNQREYVLRQQLKAILEELGEQGSNARREIAVLSERLGALPLPGPVRQLASETCSRLEAQSEGSSEYSVGYKLLQNLVALPWGQDSVSHPEPAAVRAELGRTFYGGDEVTDWVMEELAVRRLGARGGQILCLVGPPGVGKTSLAQAIARAIKRPLHTISLAGVHDVNFIRGHRRTYVGAEPGAITTALQATRTMAPVVLLDEIDKANSDFRGDMRAALLQVLDPAVNERFFDEYLGVTLDLSQVLFIATANRVEDLYPPLRSRMRVIKFWGYPPDDKLVIAREYILPAVLAAYRLEGRVIVDDDALRLIIARYTQEAGVRELSRLVERLGRRCAASLGADPRPIKIGAAGLDSVLGPASGAPKSGLAPRRVGRVNALLISDAGAQTAPIDCIRVRGTGKVNVTGDAAAAEVVREHVHLVLSVLRHRSEQLMLDPDWLQRTDLHVHLNSSVSPHDVADISLALYLAMASTATARSLPSTVGVIGAVDLHGDVAGCRDFAARMAAAQRHGLDTVLIPRGHEGEIDKLPRRIADVLEFRFVRTVDEAVTNLAEAG